MANLVGSEKVLAAISNRGDAGSGRHVGGVQSTDPNLKRVVASK